MKDYQRENVRNVVFAGQHGVGKTSLGEAFLYQGGATEDLGHTEDGSSVLDYEDEEKKRRMSLNIHVGFCEWNKSLINFLDTPGYTNFVYEAESGIHVADAAVVVITGMTGLRGQAEKFWQMCATRSLPSFIYINKIDKEEFDLAGLLAEIEKDLKITPVLFSLPMGSDESLSGVVDLMEMKARTYDPNGKAAVDSIPEEYSSAAESWREKLIEAVVETNDELLEKYLEGEQVDGDLLHKTIRDATINSSIVPVFCGAANKLIGTDLILDAIERYMPSPTQRAVIKGTDKDENPTERFPSETEDLSAFVFKTITDPYAGKISIMRVFSGSLSADSTAYNSSRQSKEKIGHMNRMIGKKQYPLEVAGCGDIVSVLKLKDTTTHDTLCTDSNPIVIPSLELPNAVIAFAIQPKTRADEDKLMISLTKLREEDPSIHFNRDEETEEFLLSGTGQMHVEVTVEKLKNSYGVNIEMHAPKVPYRETITKLSKAEGRYVKQTGGRGQYGDVWLQIEPLGRTVGFEFANKISGGSVPKNYIPSVEKGVREAMHKGMLAGYPVTDIKVTLYDGKYHPVDSSDMAFQIAGSMGFKKAMEEARPILLEPLMSVEVISPDDCIGDVIGDLNSRRAKVSGVEVQGSNHVVSAEVPMSEILTYAPELRSITSGRGMFNMEFSRYDEVPAHKASKIVEELNAEKGATE